MFNHFKTHRLDAVTTVLTFFILFFGFIMFFSASLGVMARYEEKFYGIIQNQFLFGICLGSLVYFLGAYIPKKFIKNITPGIFIVSVLLCIAVLFPQIGFMHGGARRWISILGFSFQPSEIFKFSAILFLGWYNFKFWNKLQDTKWRLFPILLLFLISTLVLIQPDLGTTAIIISAVSLVFFITSAKYKDILLIVGIGLVGIFSFYLFFPHARERVDTFLNPSEKLQNQSYQAKQTLISLGSGGLWGDGYGKSLQKYYHLPEPVGDSIFAVIGEELGFAGSVFILLVIFALAIRLILLSENTRDPFEKSVLIGTGVAILAQAFLNSASASGTIPFTGVPFPLISHGSTSIIIIMGMLGFCSQLSVHKIIQK